MNATSSAGNCESLKSGPNRRSNMSVFVDGKVQWGHRQSDLRRFIDLFHQGIIDHLIIGKEVETDWETTSGANLFKGALDNGP